MERAVELKRKISEVEDKYQGEIDALNAKLKAVRDRKMNELMEYEEELGELLFEYVNGSKELPKYPGVYMKTTKVVTIVDGNHVPREYWKPDLATIKEQLKESDYTLDIEGVEISDRRSVVIRTK